MIKSPDSETMVIFTGKPIDAEMINQLLNDHGIVTLISNKLMGSIAPWQVSAGGFEPVEIIIKKTDEQKAHGLIAAFREAE
ncbi:DUF2007 domain-containing protein [uncultured Sunxiuqinia sp.]|uniref:putative signal transducing protein n=1 Tax=uncultured Sunxiuqinia sp. TaxID=1573825 RepID=UPI0030D8D1AA|tara:strand:+ start:8747 stop:8989 length:243 start_codon:yes stop_codon:yes gene_type:complete